MDNISYYEITDKATLDKMSSSFLKRMDASHTSTKVIVTIPAHNEEASILNCLDAVFNQTTIGHKALPKSDFEVLVMCHNCSDGTFKICKDFQKENKDCNLIVVSTSNRKVNNVGAVRRILMNIASERLANNQGFIAMTDADTIVDTYWLANIMSYIDSDYGMICGKIEIDTSGLSSKMERFLKLKQNYFDTVRRIENLLLPDEKNPYPKHFDNSGPNLAIRGQTYTDIGGIKPIGFCEDVALYDEVLFNGFPLRHCPCTRVKTSSRKDTRTPWGFGKELEKFETEEIISFEVDSLQGILARLDIELLVKAYYNHKTPSSLNELKVKTGLNHEIDTIIQLNFSEIAVKHKIIKSLEQNDKWTKKYPKVSIFKAQKELQTYLVNTSVVNSV